MQLSKLIRILAVALIIGAFSACEKEGPAEKTGSRIDEIGDNIKEGESPLKEKGPLEEAGESVDEALDEEE